MKPNKYFTNVLLNRKNIYQDFVHEDEHHFVEDMLSRGISKGLLKHYFPVVSLQGGLVFEIVGRDYDTEDVVVCTVYKDGEYQGHSWYGQPIEEKVTDESH